MRINFSIVILMPVFVITDLATANEGSTNFTGFLEKDRLSFPARRLLWKSEHRRRMQTKYWRRILSLGGQSRPPSYDTYKSQKPNIILILTDDQDVELGSLNFMSETSRLLKEGGAEFRNAYTTTPMCCPSRSSMLTGLYVHNHNVYTNNDNCSSIQWQMKHETKSFAAYLSNAGYHTGYFGKYLNKYNGSYTPLGWKEWGGLIMNSKYYNYSINLNGKRIRHGDDYYKDYYTDLIANDSINFLRQWKMWNSNQPLLLVMSFPAPHGPEDSAPQYSNMFFNVTSHHTPSYDYAPNPDKQWILQVTGPMMPIHKQFTDVLMTKRLQTLQSVDHAVKRIYEQLKEIDELANSYIIYTSDHGYHLGQFGLVKGKSFPFEFDVRVPFLVRGPGIEPGIIVNDVVLNIDLAPTILDIAGIPVPAHMDGRSLMKLFQKRKKNGRKYINNWPDTFLIESSGRREISSTNFNSFLSNQIPITTSGNELENSSNSVPLNSDESSLLSPLFPVSTSENTNSLSGELNLYKSSTSHNVGKDSLVLEEDSVSRVLENFASSRKAERLSIECQKPEYSLPCKPKQKWHCILKDNRWRKHKCRFSTTQIASPLPSLQKCTCITEDGIVYVRFKTVDIDSKTKSQVDDRKLDPEYPTVIHYLNSNKSSDELVNKLAKSWRTMKRQRRNTVNLKDKISSISRTIGILDQIDEQIIDLPALDNQTNSAACMVLFNGSVICSPEMYKNLALWRMSQRSISVQIKKLQNKIKKLKEIQLHLDSIHRNINKSKELENEKSVTTFKQNEYFSQNPSEEMPLYAETSEKNVFVRFDPETSTTHRHRHHHNNTSEFITKNPTNDSLGNRRQSSSPTIPDTCYCVPHESNELSTSDDTVKEQKRQVKEQRMKKKERKLKKRAKLGKVCYLEKMNCFNHDNDHWRTPPYWTEGPFCFCMNANNNTYNCIRTINSTHNFLYCEFVTGLITFYNLRIDPFQQWNRFNALSNTEKSWLKTTLSQMMKCKGHQECGSYGRTHNTTNMETQNYGKNHLVADLKNKQSNDSLSRDLEDTTSKNKIK